MFHYLGIRNCQKLTALLLSALLFLAVMPERVIHNIFADHQDEKIQCSIEYAHIHKSAINCHADNLVVHVPFLTFDETYTLQPFEKYTLFDSFEVSKIFTNSVSHDCLRGPPTLSFCC